MKIKDGLCFDDVLIEPKYSTIKSRSEVDLSVKLSKGLSFNNPIMPANMSDILSKRMIVKMYEIGSLSLMHRFCSLEEQINLIRELKIEHGENILNFIGASIGVKPEDYKSLPTFIDLGIKIICVDIAHIDSILGLNMVDYIAKHYPHTFLIAGNVATGDAAVRVWKAGADIVKIGIGAGRICSTRLEAAAGVPQLSAIIDVYERKQLLQPELKRELYFISDGGHNKTADCVKSLCFADFVMLGGMLAGTDEAAGIKIETNGETYISYSGSSTHKKNRVEGVKGMVKPKGPIIEVMRKIMEGIQSGCSYQNCRNLKELKKDPIFVRMTNAGLTETNIRGVILQ